MTLHSCISAWRLREWNRNDWKRKSCYLLISTVFTTSDFHKTFPHGAATSVAAVKAVRNTARVQGYSDNSFLFPSEKLLSINCHLNVLREYLCFCFCHFSFSLKYFHVLRKAEAVLFGKEELLRWPGITAEAGQGGTVMWSVNPELMQHTEVMLSVWIHAFTLSSGTMASSLNMSHLPSADQQCRGNFSFLWSPPSQDCFNLCSGGWRGGFADTFGFLQDLWL